LPEKYIAKMLYKRDDGKFEEEYLKKLERISKNGSQFHWRKSLKERVISESQIVDFISFLFFLFLILFKLS